MVSPASAGTTCLPSRCSTGGSEWEDRGSGTISHAQELLPNPLSGVYPDRRGLAGLQSTHNPKAKYLKTQNVPNIISFTLLKLDREQVLLLQPVTIRASLTQHLPLRFTVSSIPQQCMDLQTLSGPKSPSAETPQKSMGRFQRKIVDLHL